MIMRLTSLAVFTFGLWGTLPTAAQPPERPSSRGPMGERPGGRGRHRAPDKLNEGDKAIDFTLRTLDGKKKVRLASHFSEKPVALIFGSYT